MGYAQTEKQQRQGFRVEKLANERLQREIDPADYFGVLITLQQKEENFFSTESVFRTDSVAVLGEPEGPDVQAFRKIQGTVELQGIPHLLFEKKPGESQMTWSFYRQEDQPQKETSAVQKWTGKKSLEPALAYRKRKLIGSGSFVYSGKAHIYSKWKEEKQLRTLHGPELYLAVFWANQQSVLFGAQDYLSGIHNVNAAKTFLDADPVIGTIFGEDAAKPGLFKRQNILEYVFSAGAYRGR